MFRKKQEVDLEDVMDKVALITETLTGMRNRLIKEGFSEQAAEQLVVLLISKMEG